MVTLTSKTMKFERKRLLILTSIHPFPGMYTIIAKQSSSRQICVLEENRNKRIIPGQNSQSPAQSPARAQCPDQRLFRERLAIRDRGACEISGDFQHTQVSHIVSLAYCNNDTSHNSLTQSVEDVIMGLTSSLRQNYRVR